MLKEIVQFTKSVLSYEMLNILHNAIPSIESAYFLLNFSLAIDSVSLITLRIFR